MFKIGVVVPNYNRVNLLDRCLSCLVEQPYGNFAIVVVDSSDDNLIDPVLKKYGDNKKLFFIHSKKRNVSVQRNIGIKYCTEELGCDFLTFVDSDDIVSDGYLTKLISFCDEHYPDLLITYLIASNNIKDFDLFSTNQSINFLNPDESANMLLNGKLSPSACGKLYKTTLFKNNLFDESIDFNEDYDFVLRVIMSCNTIFISNFRGYLYFQEGQSMTRADYLTNSQLFSLIKSNFKMLSNCYKHNDSRLVYSCEQLLIDNLLGAYPRINMKIMDNKIRDEINNIVKHPYVQQAAFHFKPYNYKTKIKKRLFIINPPLYRFLFKIFLIFGKKVKYSYAKS